ncbi:hypothetical protein QYF36_015006 [Acer negundo]|nr:hypothetical protein QYF36_015006 [Acer negundo]
MAIARACSLLLSRTELEGKNIVVASDCLQVVPWINSSGVGDWRYVQLILEIKSFLGNLGQTMVEFNSRDTNSVADSLAKKGAGGGGDVLD